MIEVAVWLGICSVALSYIAIPVLLRELKSQMPELFVQLGEPTFSTIFSRDPNNWPKQFRLMGFVLSGRVAAALEGTARIAAFGAFAAYVGLFAALAMIALLITMGR